MEEELQTSSRTIATAELSHKIMGAATLPSDCGNRLEKRESQSQNSWNNPTKSSFRLSHGFPVDSCLPFIILSFEISPQVISKKSTGQKDNQ